MKRKIIGNTVGMGLPKPNLMQTDPSKGDFVKGKEEFLKRMNKDGYSIFYANADYTYKESTDGSIIINVFRIERSYILDNGRDIQIGDLIVFKDLSLGRVSGFTENDRFVEGSLYASLKGANGDDYVLTEADKTEIAELAAQLVEIPEGGTVTDELIASALEDYLAEHPIDGNSNLLVVTFTTDESSKHTPSHTYNQIKEWVDNGGSAVLTDGKVWYNLATVSASLIRFERTVIAASGALYVCYIIPMMGDMTESVSQYDHTVSGGLIITDDENGNVTIESTGSVSITDDGDGNVTIA